MDDKSAIRSSSVASDEQGSRILALIRNEERHKTKARREVTHFICLSEIDMAEVKKNPDDFESNEDTYGPIEMTKEFVMKNPEAFRSQTLEAQKILMSLNKQLSGDFERMRPATFININNIRNINQTISISNFDDASQSSKSLNEQSRELYRRNKQEDQPKFLPKDKFTEVEVKVKSSPDVKFSSNSKAKKPAKKRVYKRKARKPSIDKEEDGSESGTDEAKKPNTKQVKQLAWDICGKKFSPQGLGGHKAKAHPGENKEYKIKQKVREENEDNRILLRLAQRYYYTKYSNVDIHPKDINRMKLAKLKTEINEDPELKASLLNSDWESFLRNKKNCTNGSNKD